MAETNDQAETEAEDTAGRSIDVPSLDELKKSGIDIPAPLGVPGKLPPTPISKPAPVTAPEPAPALPVNEPTPQKQFVVPPPIQAPKPVPEVKPSDTLQKEFPKPADLVMPKKDLPPIPSKVSLADIPLPDYMKGSVPKPAPKPPTERIDPLLKSAIETALPGEVVKATATLHEETPIERSMREIGVTQAPARLRPDMKIVSNRLDKKTELDENGLPRIRTYAADLSEEIRKRGATLTTIVGAERERQAQEEAHERELEASRNSTLRRSIYLGGGALLIVLGISAIAVAMYFSSNEPVEAPLPSIIPSNSRVAVTMPEAVDFLSTLATLRKNSALSLGEVEEFYLVRNGARVSAEEIMTMLGAPSALARNSINIMVGIHAFDRNQPFLIVSITNYDVVFQSMLTWEKRMSETLGAFFAPVNQPARVPSLTFTDHVLKNTDLRESQAEWPIVYAFPERSLLIITTNEATLREIMSRLAVSSAQ